MTNKEVMKRLSQIYIDTNQLRRDIYATMPEDFHTSKKYQTEIANKLEIIEKVLELGRNVL